MVITGISPRGRESGFRGRGDFACGIRNLRNFACGTWNPGLWNPEYSVRNPESH